MSLSASNIQRSHTGLYFETTGDGSTTTITVTHSGFNRPRTAKALVGTGGNNFARHSGFGGFYYPADATMIAGCTATVNSNGTITVTTGSAITNGVKAYCVVLFSDRADA